VIKFLYPTAFNKILFLTSLLSNDIANEAEKILNTHVFEMYGCSESGAIATRQINKGDKWELQPPLMVLVKKQDLLFVTIVVLFDFLLMLKKRLRRLIEHA
jgi:hypothetical protein